MAPIQPDSVWELMYAPYDSATYRIVLEQISPEDVILDIGAGDLRLARQMARIARKVYAVEIVFELILQARARELFPSNLIPICADARTWKFPTNITVGVLLMRHCTHFRLYADQLKSLGCQKLMTNARWRMGVEAVPLQTPRMKFEDVEIGWYACWCGAAGFKYGPVEKLTPVTEAIVHEVMYCPTCMVYPSRS